MDSWRNRIWISRSYIPSLFFNPFRFYNDLPPSLVLRQTSRDTWLQPSTATLADSWLAIPDRYYLHVFTVFATLTLELVMIKPKENLNYIFISIFFWKKKYLLCAIFHICDKHYSLIMNSIMQWFRESILSVHWLMTVIGLCSVCLWRKNVYAPYQHKGDLLVTKDIPLSIHLNSV